jgi:hypothetical protein
MKLGLAVTAFSDNRQTSSTLSRSPARPYFSSRGSRCCWCRPGCHRGGTDRRRIRTVRRGRVERPGREGPRRGNPGLEGEAVKPSMRR